MNVSTTGLRPTPTDNFAQAHLGIFENKPKTIFSESATNSMDSGDIEISNLVVWFLLGPKNAR